MSATDDLGNPGADWVPVPGFQHRRCGAPAYRHPHHAGAWGCVADGTLTFSPVLHFEPAPGGEFDTAEYRLPTHPSAYGSREGRNER